MPQTSSTETEFAPTTGTKATSFSARTRRRDDSATTSSPAHKDKKKGKKDRRQASKRRTKKQKKPVLTAKTADKHELYEESVQDPEADVKFLDRVFRKERGRKPLSLREDFGGTALLSSRWVKSNRERTAIGVDLCSETQDWGRRKHIEPLGDAAQRVKLLTEDVRTVRAPKSDIVVAFNFSFCIFEDRGTLLNYMKHVRKGLKSDGLFALDIHGGPEAFEEMEEETVHPKFTYVWDQGPVDPISHKSRRAIHFKFKDGSRLKNAFVYDWRVWTLPELRDLLLEAGFSRVDVYWEGSDKNGEGNGVFRKVEKAVNDDSWICYILGWR